MPALLALRWALTGSFGSLCYAALVPSPLRWLFCPCCAKEAPPPAVAPAWERQRFFSGPAPPQPLPARAPACEHARTDSLKERLAAATALPGSAGVAVTDNTPLRFQSNGWYGGMDPRPVHRRWRTGPAAQAGVGPRAFTAPTLPVVSAHARAVSEAVPARAAATAATTAAATASPGSDDTATSLPSSASAGFAPVIEPGRDVIAPVGKSPSPNPALPPAYPPARGAVPHLAASSPVEPLCVGDAAEGRRWRSPGGGRVFENAQPLHLPLLARPQHEPDPWQGGEGNLLTPVAAVLGSTCGVLCCCCRPCGCGGWCGDLRTLPPFARPCARKVAHGGRLLNPYAVQLLAMFGLDYQQANLTASNLLRTCVHAATAPRLSRTRARVC